MIIEFLSLEIIKNKKKTRTVCSLLWSSSYHACPISKNIFCTCLSMSDVALMWNLYFMLEVLSATSLLHWIIIIIMHSSFFFLWMFYLQTCRTSCKILMWQQMVFLMKRRFWEIGLTVDMTLHQWQIWTLNTAIL